MPHFSSWSIPTYLYSSDHLRDGYRWPRAGRPLLVVWRNLVWVVAQMKPRTPATPIPSPLAKRFVTLIHGNIGEVVRYDPYVLKAGYCERTINPLFDWEEGHWEQSALRCNFNIPKHSPLTDKERISSGGHVEGITIRAVICYIFSTKVKMCKGLRETQGAMTRMCQMDEEIQTTEASMRFEITEIRAM